MTWNENLNLHFAGKQNFVTSFASFLYVCFEMDQDLRTTRCKARRHVSPPGSRRRPLIYMYYFSMRPATHTHYTSYAAAMWPMSLECCRVAKAKKNWLPWQRPLNDRKKLDWCLGRDSTKPESLAKISLVDVETMSIGLIKIGVKKETS